VAARELPVVSSSDSKKDALVDRATHSVVDGGVLRPAEAHVRHGRARRRAGDVVDPGNDVRPAPAAGAVEHLDRVEPDSRRDADDTSGIVDGADRARHVRSVPIAIPIRPAGELCPAHDVQIRMGRVDAGVDDIGIDISDRSRAVSGQR
jgi:hypothetical protein